MSISAFTHPILSGLVGDDEIARLFEVKAEIASMLAFEAALANAQAAVGLIPATAAEAIGSACRQFPPDIGALRNGTGRDGVVVPEFVRQLRLAAGDEAGPHVHLGATSQDVIDTGLMQRLKRACEIFVARIDRLCERLRDIDDRFGDRRLMGHTRMQAAIPITVSDRIRAWREPLERHRRRLEAFLMDGFPLQFGGAAGTLDKLGDKGEAVRRAIAAELGLADQPQWQSQRDRLAEFSGLLSLVTGGLGKFGQDIALLAQMGGEVELAGGGTSSVMAHKQNPVAAETLVSLARFNAVQLSGLHHSLVHEQERSGAAWTLEWLILPPMVAATGGALRLATQLAQDLRSLGCNS